MTLPPRLGLSRDTTPDAERVYWEIMQRLSGARKLEMAMEMSENMRRIALAGIRQRHPEYNEDEVRRALLLVLQGREIYRQVYPNRDIQP